MTKMIKVKDKPIYGPRLDEMYPQSIYDMVMLRRKAQRDYESQQKAYKDGHKDGHSTGFNRGYELGFEDARLLYGHEPGTLDYELLIEAFAKQGLIVKLPGGKLKSFIVYADDPDISEVVRRRNVNECVTCGRKHTKSSKELRHGARRIW